ncbi:hypothetical protein DL544_01975 [Stenotrophomonas sp. pho]|nr:hypothetical protein DL544_01975 [Stenotrophomonas sp. pho]
MAEITPNHPDYGLNQQIRQGVAALDAQHGRAFDQTSERLTASLTVLAREQGLQQVDHVLVSNATAQHPAGHNIFVVQGVLRKGTLAALVAKYSKLPSPDLLASEARANFLKSIQARDFDPWSIRRPGDALMSVSRDIEFSIYRRYELRMRAVEIAQILADHDRTATAAVRGFPSMNSIFLSASQQRKSRAGKSFEAHLAAMLTAGGVKFEAQAILGQRRPDFVLPDQATVALDKKRLYEDAAILSAKTTLRERWKQITHERFNCAIFLATVDDRVSKEALADLQKAEITLVVPESLKMKTNESFYYNDSNVISFRTFFDEEIASKRSKLLFSA